MIFRRFVSRSVISVFFTSWCIVCLFMSTAINYLSGQWIYSYHGSTITKHYPLERPGLFSKVEGWAENLLAYLPSKCLGMFLRIFLCIQVRIIQILKDNLKFFLLISSIYSYVFNFNFCLKIQRVWGQMPALFTLPVAVTLSWGLSIPSIPSCTLRQGNSMSIPRTSISSISLAFHTFFVVLQFHDSFVHLISFILFTLWFHLFLCL